MKKLERMENIGVRKSMLVYIAFGVALLAFFYYIGGIWAGFTSVLAFLKPVFIGLAMAFVLNIPMAFLERLLFAPLARRHRVWKKLKRPCALLLTLILGIALAVLVIYIIIPKFIESIVSLAQAFPGYVDAFIAWADKLIVFYKLDNVIAQKWTEVGNGFIDYIVNFLQTAAPQFFGYTMGFATGLMNSLFGLIFAIYMLLGKEKLQSQFHGLFDAFAPEKLRGRVFYVCDVTNRCFHNFVSGQCIEACILGSLTYLGVLVMGFPYALIIGVLIGVTSLVPVVGALLGTIPCLLLLLIIRPLDAVIFLIFIIVLQQIEGNVIYPKVVGTSVGLSGIWVLFAVVVGGNVAGIPGVLLGVPVCAVIGAILEEEIPKRIARRRQEALADTDKTA